MQSSTLLTYFFNKHLKHFKQITPFIYGYCFESRYRRYSLQTNFFRLFYSQPPRRKRRRKYFKYDMFFWTDGAEGHKFRPRILRWGFGRIRFGFIKNANFYHSAPCINLFGGYNPELLNLVSDNFETTSSSSEY